jgi:hypothetical protein
MFIFYSNYFSLFCPIYLFLFVRSGVGLFFFFNFSVSVYQSSFQKLILVVMVIWKLSQAYEYFGNRAYLLRHNFNYQLVYMSYRYLFCEN